MLAHEFSREYHTIGSWSTEEDANKQVAKYPEYPFVTIELEDRENYLTSRSLWVVGFLRDPPH